MFGSVVIAGIGIAFLSSRPFVECLKPVCAEWRDEHPAHEPSRLFGVVRCIGVATSANHVAITAIATVVTAIFSGLLYRATNNSNDISRRAMEGSHQANRISEVAAKAARDSADAAVAAERPFLFLEGEFSADFESFRENIGWIKYGLRNHGQTPAVIRECFSGSGYRSSYDDFTSIPVASHSREAVVVGPGMPTEPTMIVLRCDATERGNAMQGVGHMLIVVRIEYDDVFKNRHEVGYAASYEPLLGGFMVHWGSRLTFWRPVKDRPT